MEEIKKKNVNTKFYINVLIGLLFMFLFPCIGAQGQVTDVGMSILGIFIGMIWLWITVDAMWPSLLALVLVGLANYVPDVTGYDGVKAVLTTAFGNDTLLNITFITLLFSAVSALGLTDHIVTFFMKRKALEGRPYIMLLLFMMSAYTVGGTTDPIVSLFILWPAVTSLCSKYGIKKTDRAYIVMVMGIFLGATLGQPMLAFKGMTAALFGLFASITGITINLAVYLVFNIGMAILIMSAFLIMARFVLKPDFTPLKVVKTEELILEQNPMTTAQKAIGILLLMLIAGMLLPNILPETFPGVSVLKSYGVLGIEGVLMSIAMILRNKDGSDMIDVRKIAQTNFSWNIFFQIAAANYIATALTSDVTGIKTVLIDTLKPVLGGLPGIVFVMVVIATTIVITQVFNNMVAGVIMITVSSQFIEIFTSTNFGALTTMLIMSVCMAAMLPSGSIYCSYLHSSKDVIDIKGIYKVYIPTLIVIAIIYICVGFPIASMLFK